VPRRDHAVIGRAQGGESQPQAGVLELGLGGVALCLGGEFTGDQLVGLAGGDQLFLLQAFAAARIGGGDVEVGVGLGQRRFGLAQLHLQAAGIEHQQGLAGGDGVADLDQHLGHALAVEFDAQAHFLPGGDRAGGGDTLRQRLLHRGGDADGQAGGGFGGGGVVRTGDERGQDQERQQRGQATTETVH
jgi:hypothetical protein